MPIPTAVCVHHYFHTLKILVCGTLYSYRSCSVVLVIVKCLGKNVSIFINTPTTSSGDLNIVTGRIIQYYRISIRECKRLEILTAVHKILFVLNIFTETKTISWAFWTWSIKFPMTCYTDTSIANLMETKSWNRS